MNTVNLLTEILLDSTASISDRDDAAMCLGSYDDDKALEALLKVASDPKDEASIRDVCGESIAQIWVKRNNFDVTSFVRLLPEAKREAEAYIRANKPDWLKLISLE